MFIRLQKLNIFLKTFLKTFAANQQTKQIYSKKNKDMTQ